MGNWRSLEDAEPALAAAIRACFTVRKHATLATLRRDGAPRISGIEVEFSGDEVVLGSMPGAVKALDLQRDPRFALHSPTVDPPSEDPASWPGEAKLAGLVVEVTASNGTNADKTTSSETSPDGTTSDGTSPGNGHRFRLVLQEAVLTTVVGDELEVRSWHAGRGLTTRRRS